MKTGEVVKILEENKITNVGQNTPYLVDKPKIFLATPCYGGLLTTHYFQSCLKLMTECMKKGIGIQFALLGSESLIPRARNTLVQLFMDDEGKSTHLMFIDADIGFNYETVLHMVERNKEVLSSVAPQKKINWHKVKEKIRKNPDVTEKELSAYALEYVLHFKDPNNIKIEEGLVEVKDAGSGFMLIKRQVFEKMAKAYPHLKFKSEHELASGNGKNLDYHKTSDWNYDFFDTMIDPDTNTYLSEDYAFCRRWQKIGGSVYADITSGLTHHGTYGFAGDIKTQFLKRDE